MSKPRWLHAEWFVWLLGVLTALAAHGASTSVLEMFEGHFHWTLFGWLTALVLFTFGFYYFYANPVPRRLNKELDALVFWKGAVPWLLAALAAIALYGVAAGIHRAFDGSNPLPAPVFLGYLFAFGLVMSGLYFVREDVLIIKTRSMADGAGVDRPPVRHLIWILSSIDEKLFPGCVPAIAWSNPPKIRTDLDTLESSRLRWKWQMLLAAVEPHVDSLTEITLICSGRSAEDRDEFAASLPQAPAAARFVGKYKDEYKNKVTVNVWALVKGQLCEVPALDETLISAETTQGFNFSDFTDLSGAFSDLMKYLRFVRKIPQHSLVVDFTGGMKPPSVVAAAVTFRGEVRTQYVDTNTLVAKTYDLVTNPESPGA